MVLAVLLGTVLRVTGIAWDGWQLQHPDERFLVMVADRLEVPLAVGDALDPWRTPANPNNQGFDFYVYGAFPPFATKFLGRVLGLASLRGLVILGRVLSVILDVANVLLVAALARRLAGPRAAGYSSLLYATCGLAVQQARFATTDVWGLTAVLLAIWAVVGRPVTWHRLLGSGAAVGLAAACKPNLLLALAVPMASVALDAWPRRREGFPTARWVATRLAALSIVAIVALKVTDPGAFASTLSPLPSPRRVASLTNLAGVFVGLGQYPPNLQWADRRAVIDPLANLLIWGTGPLLGIAVLAGAARVFRRAMLGERIWIPILVWLLPAAGWQLTRFVCSVRHLEPFLPVAVVAAGVWLVRRSKWLRLATVATTVVWGTAWAAIAWQPHTRLEASRWLEDNLPRGATVTAEYWDDALPLPDPVSEGLSVVTLRVFDPDTVKKRNELLAGLERADAVVLASQRGVGSICRVPDAYPLTAEYYHLLFSGALGFRMAASFTRNLGAGRLAVSDLAAEESLSVYDHPPVWVFRKTDRYRSDLARRLLERVPLPGPEPWQTRDLEARGSPPYLAPTPGGRPLPAGLVPGWPRQAVSLVGWVAAIELLGLLGCAIVRRVAPTLPDGGWGVARWLGVVTAGLGWLWLGFVGLPGWNSWLPAVLLLGAALWGGPRWLKEWHDRRFRSAAALFWSVFALFLVLRAYNPEVYWGEKPMDAAIFNALWRADTLPPVDPWFAGAPLHYYFFGFLPFAALGRALFAGLGVVFNLAAATVPALTAGAAASVGWLLAGRARGGVLAAALAQLVGTAAAVFRPGMLWSPGFASFWESSRVIPDTINEYPVWTALFADLHAHFFGFPGFLTAVLLASALALGALRGKASAVVVGLVLAIEAMTNTWEIPVLLLLVIAGRALRRGGRRSWRDLVRGGGWLLQAGATATVLALPFWLAVRPVAGEVALYRGPATPVPALAELFGVAAVLTVTAATATWLAGKHASHQRWTWILVAVGWFVVVVPEFITVSDRMNTVFKFHLQAHLLLAVAVAGLLGACLPAIRGQWRTTLAIPVAMAVAVGLATSVGDAAAVVRTRRVAGPRPTLNGAAYLRVNAPPQAKALEALAALPAAAVAVETPGPAYTDALRVPMFSGHPAVVGWEYHLWQRRHSWPEIRTRQEDLAVLLWGGDMDVVSALADRYHVGLACTWEGYPAAVSGLPGWWRLVDTPDVQVAMTGREGGR